MKGIKFMAVALASAIAVPALAGTPKRVVVPVKQKTSDPVNNPKVPPQTYIYVNFGETDDELDFEMSPNIHTLYVILTTGSTGEIQTGAVDRENHVMTVTLTEGISYTLTCTTDAGYEFETILNLMSRPEKKQKTHSSPRLNVTATY